MKRMVQCNFLLTLGCEMTMEANGNPWPLMFDCDKFPSDNLLCIIEDEKPSELKPSELKPYDPAVKAKKGKYGQNPVDDYDDYDEYDYPSVKTKKEKYGQHPVDDYD